MSKQANKSASNNWSPESWRKFPINQQPDYPDAKAVKDVEARLQKSVPLVTPDEIKALRAKLKDVAEGKAFLLQGGDCAESFAEFNQDNLKKYFRVMLQMTVALMYGAGKPVVKVGRIAGQFAKPRSAPTETENGKELPSYRGDMVNGIEFEEAARKPDPQRLVDAYHQSAATLNYLRALATGGYASLRNVNEWNKEFATECKQRNLFEELVSRINDSFSFMNAWGLDLTNVKQFQEADFFTSHEALLLGYEESLTRYFKLDDKYYNCSAHLLWIGDRTRKLDEAHVEFMRGIANPIGCKVGPSMKPDELVEVIKTLNPDNEPGKLTLISRMGADKVDEFLPPLVRAVRDAGLSVIWSCDPMHGNTVKSPNGYKTRHFNKILSEVRSFFDIHHNEGTYAGGVHFEMTGQDVTECVGGAQAISEVNLKERYHTHCDPRLNASQALELAFLIAEELRKR